MPVSVADVQNAIRDGIVSLAATAPGAGAAAPVVWAEEQRPAAGKGIIILKIVQWDADVDREEYTEYPDNPGQLVWTLSTLHYIRIQVQCETQYNAPGVDAFFLLEKIRAGLRRPDLVFDHGIMNHPDINTYVHRVSFVHGSHVISAYSFETNFRAVTDFSLDGPLPAGTNMQTVEVLGEDADPPAANQTIDRNDV
jgi:hypothetical protein